MKAWLVSPYNEDWCFIVHAETRAQARVKALPLIDEWTAIKAIRLPVLDNVLVTMEKLLEAGFPSVWEGEPISVASYLLECGCELCNRSLKALKEGER